jgi:hypothetical protein
MSMSRSIGWSCLVVIASALGCASSPPSPSPPVTVAGYTWEQVAPPGAGAFPEEWSEGEWPMTLVPIEAFGGKLYMVGQKATWSSSDALAWARQDKTDWGERIGASQVFFADKLWMMGGLRYADSVMLDDIWSSSDGSQWQNVGKAQWPARRGATLLAFQNQLWLFGGARGADADKGSKDPVNDVWRSANGLSFARVTDAAPWSPRELPRVVLFKGQLYLIGGQGHSDVWTSPDGIAWTELTAEAPWGKRWDFGALVFDDKLWVFGGREEVSTNAHHDVWSSSDGQTWQRQGERAPWTPRSGMHSVVYLDRLWIFSGKHTGADDNWGGDIWTMRRAGAAP